MRSHSEILSRLLAEKVIAIVRLDCGEQLVRVAEAVWAGGICAIEFALTTPRALEQLEKASARFGDQVLLGAGTVLDPNTARVAMLAGADFIVTPTVQLRTVEICKRYGRPIVAGAMTPSEIMAVWEAGADLVKVFPVGNLGGADYIRAVLAPLPQVRLVPTGGVSSANAGEYLRAGAAAVAVGGSLVDKQAVTNGDWAKITSEAERLHSVVTNAVQGFNIGKQG